MQTRTILASLGGALSIYVVMAACGGGGSGTSSSSSGGSSASSAGGGLDAFVDQLTNPVKDAKADPTPPDVATENCDKIDGSSNQKWAVHSYPGKTFEQLAMVHAVGHSTSPTGVTIGGSDFIRFTPVSTWLRDGSVAVSCGNAGTPYYDSVTFVLPN